jgi:hypothetical protein
MNYQTYLEQKAIKRQKPLSVQSRFDNKAEEQYWILLNNMCGAADRLPPMGSKARDRILLDIWPQEPILAGIIYTQQARLAAMHWTITGNENEAKYYAEFFQNLGYGAGWDTEVKKWSQDYLVQSRGALWEKGREGGPDGKVVGLAYMDIDKCDLTGNPGYPIQYNRTDGKSVLLPKDDIIHRCAMPSGREEAWGSGMCLVDRALRAIRLLMSLHKYEEDQLDDMPPDGIATVSGMDMASITRAMQLWKDKRDSKDLTFRRLLWLVGNPLGGKVELEYHPFTELPKEFNRREVIETYVKTVALSAGEDPNEFWLFVHTGATKGIGTLLHEKGQGKGVVEMASVLERAFNWEVLPDGVEFAFDYRDRTAQKIELDRQASAIKNILSMWTPPPGKIDGLIPVEVALEMCVMQQVMTAKQAAVAGEFAINAPERVGDMQQVMTDTEGGATIGESQPGNATVEQKERAFVKLMTERIDDLEAKSKELENITEELAYDTTDPD